MGELTLYSPLINTLCETTAWRERKFSELPTIPRGKTKSTNRRFAIQPARGLNLTLPDRMQTLMIDKFSCNQDCYKCTSILLIKIVLFSRFP